MRYRLRTLLILNSRLTGITICAFIVIAAIVGAEKPKNEELKELQGEWREVEQHPELFGFFSGARFVIVGDQMTVGSRTMTIKLDPTKTARSTWEVNKLATAITSTTYFMEWIQRIQAIPDGFIDCLCEEAKELEITSDEAEMASEFLRIRRFDLAEIIVSNKSFFKSVTQDGLFLQ